MGAGVDSGSITPGQFPGNVQSAHAANCLSTTTATSNLRINATISDDGLTLVPLKSGAGIPDLSTDKARELDG